MPMIYVRTRPGRRADYEGKLIPNDKFEPVADTPYIRRLRDHWRDIEQEGAPGTKAEMVEDRHRARAQARTDAEVKAEQRH